MMNSALLQTRRVCLLATIVLVGAGCSETYQSTALRNPTPAVEAVLLVSDLAATPGSSIVVLVKASGNMSSVASYTARIKYDVNALRFDGETLTDKELRAMNPAAGEIRIAGVAPKGFADGVLAGYKFVVLQKDGAKTLSLGVDEMHMVTQVDAKPNLTIAPVRTTPAR